MNEQRLIKIEAKLCIHGKGCSDVDLSLTQAEVVKIYQLAPSSKGETVDYSQYMEFWAVSFSATLTLWLLAYVCGRVLKFLK